MVLHLHTDPLKNREQVTRCEPRTLWLIALSRPIHVFVTSGVICVCVGGGGGLTSVRNSQLYVLLQCSYFVSVSSHSADQFHNSSFTTIYAFTSRIILDLFFF